MQVAILTHMAAWGTHFTVDPDHFLVHLPHSPVVPLAAMSNDPTVMLYSQIVPFVLTQLMVEEMQEQRELWQNTRHLVPGIGLVGSDLTRHRGGGGGAGAATARGDGGGGGVTGASDVAAGRRWDAGGDTAGVHAGGRADSAAGSAVSGAGEARGAAGVGADDRGVSPGGLAFKGKQQTWVADLLRHIRRRRGGVGTSGRGGPEGEVGVAVASAQEGSARAGADAGAAGGDSGQPAVSGEEEKVGMEAAWQPREEGEYSSAQAQARLEAQLRRVVAEGAHALAPLLLGDAQLPECRVDAVATLEACVALTMALLAFTVAVMRFL